MQLNLIASRPFVAVHANNIDAFIPEMWANESLAILSENMVAANLVHRDFEPEFANFGDIVNTRRPGEFTALRKTNDDEVTVQDATATNVQVPLDQHMHVSFMIKDGEEKKSFKNLVETYLSPAVLALSRMVDQVVLGQYPQFIANAYGSLLGLSSSNVKDRILGTRNLMNVNKAYVEGRNLIWCPDGETVALQLAEFTNAQDTGDDGTAQAEAFLGRKFGFQNYMCQNMASVATGNTTSAGAINLTAGYAKGTTSALVVDGITGIIATGTWLKIAGDDAPNQVVAHSETLGNTVGITLRYPLRAAVVNDAVITFYTPGAINFGAGYAAGYSKTLTIDGFTVAPKAGQIVSFGTGTGQVLYTVVSATTTSLVLDRPLEAALLDDAVVNIGPAGQYNLAFHRNAMTLAIRPLDTPRSGTGAASASVNAGGLTMRVVITYDGRKQGHLVTLDFLAGIKVLDSNLGAVLLG
jgi:hypothetical protein